jgi:protein-L-isoaspartate O-methyltransferase
VITTTPRKRGTHDPTANDPPPDEHTDALPRPLALPTGDLADVLEYLGEWETIDGAPSTRSEVRRTPTGRMLGGNEIGPYCAITLSQLGGPDHRAIAARATDATLDVLRSRIVTNNDTLHFQLVGHEQTGLVLVIARHGKILGDHWLAYVEADTLPRYPYAQRDKRVEETCQSLRDSGHTPYVRRLEDGVIEVEPAERGTKLKASIDALGAVTRTWGNGRSSVEPPRDSDEARRAAEQLKRHPPHHPNASATAEANGHPTTNGRPAEAPVQQSLFDDKPPATASVNETVPVRRSTVEDTVVEVLARVEVTDDLVMLPGQLERGLYEKVNKALTALGGKWNRRRGGHVFPLDQPIGDELAGIVDGRVLERMLTGYFPTPRPLAERLIALADVRAEHLVLEPSAGRGGIADLIAAVVPVERLYLVERDPTHHQALARAGYRPPQLICDDFLTTTALPERFDRIVMNPPFERQQDVAHVMHAYGLLAPGGRLGAITGAGVAFRTDKRTGALRELIEQNDGSIAENQPDAFKESGTSVNTLIIALTKPTD